MLIKGLDRLELRRKSNTTTRQDSSLTHSTHTLCTQTAAHHTNNAETLTTVQMDGSGTEMTNNTGAHSPTVQYMLSIFAKDRAILEQSKRNEKSLYAVSNTKSAYTNKRYPNRATNERLTKCVFISILLY